MLKVSSDKGRVGIRGNGFLLVVSASSSEGIEQPVFYTLELLQTQGIRLNDDDDWGEVDREGWDIGDDVRGVLKCVELGCMSWR